MIPRPVLYKSQFIGVMPVRGSKGILIKICAGNFKPLVGEFEVRIAQRRVVYRCQFSPGSHHE